MKFPTPHKIGEVRGNQPASRRCYVNYMRKKNQRETLTIETKVDPREEECRPFMVEELVEEEVDGVDKKERIEATLTAK